VRRAGPWRSGASSVKDYEYSEALAKKPVVWTRQNLTRWLTDPESLIPGQRMGYRLGEAKDRADVVAYLATLK
jgi:cytochrome c